MNWPKKSNPVTGIPAVPAAKDVSGAAAGSLWSRRIAKNAAEWLEHRSRVSVTIIGVALLCFFGLLDYLATPEMVFTLFYLVPILLVAGRVGRMAGMTMAVASAVVWLVTDFLGPAKHTISLIPYWNALVNMGVFLTAAWLMSVNREFQDDLQNRVEQRTEALQAEAAVRRLTEEHLRASEQRFRQVTEAISEVFWMTNIEKTEMIYVSPGYEKVWGRTCQSLYGNPASWSESIHAEDRDRVRRASLTLQSSGNYDIEYRVLRPDGSMRWIHDRAYPVSDVSGNTYRIAGIAEDITERKRMEQELLMIIECEQTRIALELHDGLCQQLARTALAVNLIGQDLAAKVPVDPSSTSKVASLLDDAITQSRSIARGLYPIHVADGRLDSALDELCSDTRALFPIACDFVCQGSVPVRDVAAATHLYRIAQEAVHNALKHGQARRIVVAMHSDDRTLTLRITDDGVGIGACPPGGGGMGLRIMQYRAAAVGATLEVDPVTTGGTAVCCSLPLENC